MELDKLDIGLIIAGSAVVHLIIMGIAFALPKKVGWSRFWNWDGLWLLWGIGCVCLPEAMLLVALPIHVLLMPAKRQRNGIPEARVIDR